MNRQSKMLIGIASCFILTAIILGALAAHALKTVLTSDQLESFTTAVRYQMWMGMGALLMVFGEQLFLGKVLKTAWWILIGGLLFSGSIYLLTALPEGHEMRKIVGPVTPIGGLLMIFGWGMFIFRMLRQQSVR